MRKLRFGDVNQLAQVTSGRAENRTPSNSLELTPELPFWKTGKIEETG